jgi:hypothetical protein
MLRRARRADEDEDEAALVDAAPRGRALRECESPRKMLAGFDELMQVSSLTHTGRA